MNRIRAMVWYKAAVDDRAGLAAAFGQISVKLQGTPGLIGTELLSSSTEPDTFVVTSEWESLEAFRTWERATEHSLTAELRRYLDLDRIGIHWDLFGVDAAY